MAWMPDYVTLAEMKANQRISDTVDDSQLAVAITAASRVVDDYCNRQFGQVAAPEERFYTAYADRSRGQWVVEIDDLMTTTGLVVEVASSAATAYTLEPVNAAAKGRPWTRLAFTASSSPLPDTTEGQVGITAQWGWSAVPTQVKQATLFQAARFVASRDMPYGVAGADSGEVRFLAPLDPTVKIALRGLARLRRGA